jgi:hypothetical protein
MFIKLLRDDCHKQAVLISERRDDLNQCTPCTGKPDQHVTCFSQSVRVWLSTIHISRGPRLANFHESQIDLDGSHRCRETRIPDYIPNTSADRSAGLHPVSLPLTTSEAVGLSQTSVDNKLLGLLGPYTSMRLVRSIHARGGQHIGP